MLQERWWITLLRAGVLVLLAAAAGLAANAIRPNRIPWLGNWAHHAEARALKEHIRLTSPARARERLRAGGVVFLDARPAADFARGRIQGAFSLPQAEIAERFGEMQAWLDRGQEIVIYCSSAACDESLLVTLFLRSQGYTNLHLLMGGLAEWQTGGYPVER